MSYSSNDTTSETSSEDENPNQTWKIFKLTNSLKNTNSKQYDLLKTASCPRSVTSPLGDIRFSVGNTKYILDRAILASKSYQLRYLVTDYDENEFTNEIGALIDGDDTRFSNIVDIIYGKELETVMTENNFAQLFHDMYWMRLEIDLEIFRKFIEKNIQQKEELKNRMFHFYRTLILNYYLACDYLLPILSQHISDHLREIYEMEEFLSLPAEGFFRILFNKSKNSQEKGSIGHICAKWICHDFQTRINHLKDLVNVVKFRYGLISYCDWNPDLMKFLEKNQGSDESPVKEVEQYFNKLFFNHGKVNFVFPQNLKDGLCCIKYGDRVIHYTDQIDQWMSFLKEDILCDVAINVKGTIFKLHRVKLLLASEYFRDLFTDQNESSTTNAGDKSTSDCESTTMEYSLDNIDPVTFQSIIQYIYEHKIKVTSQSHLLSLMKASQFLKMKDLSEKCFLMVLKIARNVNISNIFGIFQHTCDNAKYSKLYNGLAKKMVELLPKLHENPNFKHISLETLLEILEIPNLTLKNPDEILDLCSRWIFHDVENRYHCMIQVALAINRNSMLDSDKLHLEIPLNTTFSEEYVKEQLTKMLSSTALVSLDAVYIQDKPKKPKFLLLNWYKFLSVVDADFNEIIKLAQIEGAEFRYSATTINYELFILFNNGDQFYFQSYSLIANRTVSLATDSKMSKSQDYAILSCKNQVYYCDEYNVLKYDTKLNRWISFLYVYNKSELFVKYTSDGIGLFRTFMQNDKESYYKASFYDFYKEKWNALPKISDFDGYKNSTNKIIRANIIDNEFCVMFLSKIHRFNWKTHTWKYIGYPNENFSPVSRPNENFVEFTGQEENFACISNKNRVYVYSHVLDKWTLKQILYNLSDVVAIHTIEK